MKKDVIITVRITEEIKETIQSLADKDERTLGWMARKLLLEALEARNLLKGNSVHEDPGVYYVPFFCGTVAGQGKQIWSCS